MLQRASGCSMELVIWRIDSSVPWRKSVCSGVQDSNPRYCGSCACSEGIFTVWMFTPSFTSLPDRFCGSREILSSVCPTHNGGMFLSTFRLQINKHSDSSHLPSREELLLGLFTGICVGFFSRKAWSYYTKTGQTEPNPENWLLTALSYAPLGVGRFEDWGTREDTIKMVFTEVSAPKLRHPATASSPNASDLFARCPVLISAETLTILTEFFSSFYSVWKVSE